MKKFVSILICIVMLTLSFPCAINAEDVSLTKNQAAALKVVNALDIMEIEDTDADSLSREVTRIEFVTYLAKLLNINASTEPKVYFSDVEKNSSYCGLLTEMYDRGYVLGNPGEKFEPDRGILYEEAYKMIVDICGYKEMAKLYGGYPSGYLKVASNYGLTISKTTGKTVNVLKCAEILYTVSIAPIYEMDYDGSKVRYEETDKTLLSIYKDIYTYKGNVTSVFGVSLDGSTAVKSGDIRIGDKAFVLTENTKEFENTKYLGVEVYTLYHIDENEKEYAYVLWTNEDEDDVLNISAEDFIAYDNYSISYRKGISSTKNISIAKGATYIYNGVRVDGEVTSLYDNFKRGSILLRKTGVLSGYDLVLINSYENFVVGAYSESTSTLREYDNYSNTIDLEEYENIKYFDNSIETDKLNYAMGDVLTIARYDKTIWIYKVNKAVSGTISAIGNSDDEVEITLGDNVYEIDEDCYRVIESRIAIGRTCTVKFDLFDKIAHIEFGISEDWIFAYLLETKYYRDEDTNEFCNRIEVYNQYGEFLTLYFDDKLTFDDVSVKNKTDLRVYYPGYDEGVVPMQMIRYKLNSEGVIKKMDTCGDGEDSINETSGGMATNKIYSSTQGMFFDASNNQILVDSNTVLMNVPYQGTTYEEIKDYKESYFSIGKVVGTIGNAGQITVLGYTVGDDDISPIMIQTAESKEAMNDINQYFVFNKVVESMNADGDEIYQELTGYDFRGQEVSYLVAKGEDCSGLQNGDVIGAHKSAIGNDVFLKNITMIYDYNNPAYDSEEAPPEWAGYVADRKAWFGNRIDYRYMVMGTVTDVKKNILHMSTHTGGKTVQMYDASKAPVVVVDTSRNNNNIYVGSMADISIGSRVLMQYSDVVAVGAVVYK